MNRPMKDSGIPWIGEIPEKWDIYQTSTIFHEHKEKNIGLKNTNLLSLSYGSIKRKDINTNEGLLPQSFETYNVIKRGDIVFRLTDLQNDKRSLRTGLCLEDGIITSAYVTLRANKEVSSSYYHYLFHTYDVCKVFYGMGDGVRQGMNWDDVRKIVVFCPELEEQRRIAEFLDKKCGEIDETITLQEEFIEELKAYKQSVITEAVTRGLNPNVKLKDSGIDWIGKIPQGWNVRRIKTIGSAKNGLTYSPSDMSSEEDGILVLRSSNIQNGKLCFDDNVFVSTEIPTELMVHKGDLIICSRNGSAALVGKCAMVEDDDLVATYGAFMMRFQSQYIKRYIYYLLSSAITQYKPLFTTTTINQLTVGIFGSLAVPFSSSKTEQQQIADYLDNKCAEIDSLIAIKQQKIEELKDYKKSIIYEYVTGKKEVK